MQIKDKIVILATPLQPTLNFAEFGTPDINTTMQEAKDVLLTAYRYRILTVGRRRKTKVAKTNMPDIITIIYEMKTQKLPVFCDKKSK